MSSLTLFRLDRTDPSVALRGSSNDTGPSSSVTGLVGVTGTGLEPGDSGVKLGATSLKPGLFGEGSMAEGDRARLA